MADSNTPPPEFQTFNAEPTPSNDKLNDVVALNQLVNVIVDYYSFKNQIDENDPDSVENWKKTLGKDDSDSFIVPSKIDNIIEKAFTTQLKKFT